MYNLRPPGSACVTDFRKYYLFFFLLVCSHQFASLRYHARDASLPAQVRVSPIPVLSVDKTFPLRAGNGRHRTETKEEIGQAERERIYAGEFHASSYR